MTVAIIVVNWNAGELLRRCLEAIGQQRRRPDHVIVVDNASTDDSLARVSDLLTSVEVIRLETNVGFAAANNVAARRATAFDGLVLLNPDAFPEPGWLEALVGAAVRHPSFGSFASQIRFSASPDQLDGAGDSYHVSGRAWRNGHGSPTAEGSREAVEVFAACAAAALYQRSAFEEAHGFDESYFCYFEDVDLGFRLRLRGYRCLYVPDAVVRHVSSATSGYRSDFSVYHGERNMVWTFVKDMPGWLFWFYLPQHLLLNLAALVYFPWRRQGRVVLRAKLDALRQLPRVWRQRRVVQAARRADIGSLRHAFTHGLARPYRGRYTWASATTSAVGYHASTGAATHDVSDRAETPVGSASGQA